MIKRNKMFQQSRIAELCEARLQFNKILHEAIGLQDHRVMSIRTCKSPDDFDALGNLSNQGQIKFWKEIDYLLEKFDRNKVKLLPKLHIKSSSSRNQPTTYNNEKGRTSHYYY